MEYIFGFKPPKFKTGEKVRVISGDESIPPENIGQTGRITKVEPAGDTYWYTVPVSRLERSDPYFACVYDEGDLERVPEQKKIKKGSQEDKGQMKLFDE